jgi:hypothetical protein
VLVWAVIRKSIEATASPSSRFRFEAREPGERFEFSKKPSMTKATKQSGNGGAERRIFGTDGVRGTANIEPVTAETALKLGPRGGARLRRAQRPTE